MPPGVVSSSYEDADYDSYKPRYGLHYTIMRRVYGNYDENTGISSWNPASRNRGSGYLIDFPNAQEDPTFMINSIVAYDAIFELGGRKYYLLAAQTAMFNYCHGCVNFQDVFVYEYTDTTIERVIAQFKSTTGSEFGEPPKFNLAAVGDSLFALRADSRFMNQGFGGIETKIFLDR